MGRKKLPTNLKILKNTVRKSRENKNEPFPMNEIPEAPEHLSAEALIEWNRISKVLFNLGLLTGMDMASLAAYCQAYGRWVQAETELKTESLVLVSDKGNHVQNPLVGIANQAMEHMRKHLANFGMSPADRTKVSSTKKQQGEKDPWGAFG